MVDIKQAAEKLKKIVAGATLMAGIAMGTGCDGSQQIHKIPSEDTVNDNDENNINDENGNKNDENNPIEDNDGDTPINNNDNDGPTEHNDDDKDSIINDDMDDPIEHNDDDNNPSEHDDSDNTNDSNRFFPNECVAEIKNLENLTQDQLEAKKDKWHDVPKNRCPYNYIRQPEIYDESTGCVFIVDKCEGDLEEPMWFENAAPKVIFDLYGVPPPKGYGIVSMTSNSNGGQSNMKIRVPMLLMDVNFVSKSCLSQADENTSIIKMLPNAYNISDGCKIDGENEALPIETKSTKQIKIPASEYTLICESLPNYQLVEYDNACYVTIDEFVWLENVANKLIANPSPEWWWPYDVAVKSITRDLDTGVFSITMQIGTKTNTALNVYITLNNAKSCIDQCYGKEGCTSHIEPISQDPSKGCFINGTEVNGEESAQNFKMKKHNLKYKHAPRFIKPAPAFAKQNYVKSIRPNRQKWLAQNVRNFGRNGR